MKSITTALLALALCSSAVAAPIFTAYVAKDATREGEGAEKVIVDGMDFWSNGSPPRKFEILGFLTDKRHSNGLYGAIRMSSLNKEIADAARANGGDAVILVHSETEVVGVASTGGAYATGTAYGSTANASAFGYGLAKPIEKQETKFAVIKYLDGTPAPKVAEVAPKPAQ